MDYRQELGVQSFCYRGFKTNEEVAARVRECGLNRIELCGVHADLRDESQFDRVIETYRKAGVQIMGIGVQTFAGDEAAERPYFEFVRRAGAATISADFAPDTVPGSFRVAERLADEYGVNLAIHNHGGRHWLGSSQMLATVFNQTSPRIGLMLDTAWALHSHEDPIQMVRDFADRVYGVHIKDFVFDRAGSHRDVVVGTGNLDLPLLLHALDEIGFGGSAILEYEGDVENPVPALTDCAAAVEAAR